MSFNAVSERLLECANQLDQQMPDIIALAVMAELSARHKQRIFADGKRTNGTDIGEYSTDPGYYGKDKFIRKGAFKAIGKGETGKDANGKNKKRLTTTVFNIETRKSVTVAIHKDNRERKSMFLAKGYSEFRDIQGRQTDKINLKYSGSLEANLNVLKDGDAALYGTTDKVESDKFEALESKYEVFGTSIEEQQFLKEEIINQAIIVAKKQ